ncbi:UbiA prenyltransferase family protein [Sphaerisporangium aureirubrum]|uniref:UbiA prenyltransferase family protein n=1 Tax=Sphaerisporangium aureirubrum TaxID=1544736 RepID=A0ABW1NH20_9ACTN
MPTSSITGGEPLSPPTPPLARPNGLRVRALISLARPGHWAKNLLVVPLVMFDAQRLDLTTAARVGWSLVLFVIASSVVYVVNDIADRERDLLHPAKRSRPLAAGTVSLASARAFAAVLALLLLLAVVTGPAIPVWPLLTYLVVNVAYSHWLKHVALFDVFVVTSGFVLRAAQGYAAAQTRMSVWLLASVFTLCLLMIAGKRRHEMTVGGMAHRPSLAAYSIQFLDYLMVLGGVLTATTFMLYLSDRRFAEPHTDAALIVSLPCVVFALARYLQVVVVEQGGGDPVRTLLRDRVLLVTSLVWATALAVVAGARHVPLLSGLLVGS